MSVILVGKPFHRIGFSTRWAGSTYAGVRKSSGVSAIGFFDLAARFWGIGILAVFLHALVDYSFALFRLTAWNFALLGALNVRGVRRVSHSLSVRE